MMPKKRIISVITARYGEKTEEKAYRERFKKGGLP
jgi:uncharacterized DUF497 family protein